MSDKRGVQVRCVECGLPKKPIGRSAPLPMSNSLCDYECAGYRQDPHPGSLWPGELESTFGYPVGDDATEPAEDKP